MRPASLATTGRLNWIDWMKVIGIYLIAYGHLFSIGNIYVYVFSVPLFFIISGFLCKKEENTNTFWKKLWYNLILPMILISLLNFIIGILLSVRKGVFDPASIYKFPIFAILGFHAGVGTLWFVYTLIILKVINQYLPSRIASAIVSFIIFPAMGIAINHWNPTVHGVSLVYSSNAAINVCMASPFFCIGTLLRTKKSQLVSFDSLKLQILLFVFCLAIVYLCGRYNGGVWMYIDGYGNNIVLFIIGGFSGTAMIYVVSKWLDSIHHKVVTDLSNGTIVILGFHYYVIALVRKISPSTTYLDPIFAIVIILVFVPIIWLVEKHLPYLMGIYRVKKTN